MLQRAQAAGVAEIITVGCDMADTDRAMQAAREFDLYASVGVHPHEAIDAPEDLHAAFAPYLSDERIIAVGETGLDYYYDHSPRDIQREVLRKQVRIGREAGKPLIFHHRDAFDDFLAILRAEFAPPMRGVIHCFTGDADQATAYVEEFGLFLGVGGVVTFKTAQQVRDAVLAVGLQHIILETDCPYLAPVPHRGKRNEPAFISETAKKLAELFERSYEDVCAITSENARTLFGL